MPDNYDNFWENSKAKQIAQINNFDSLFQYLHKEYGWKTSTLGQTYEWTTEELDIPEEETVKFGGTLYQIPPFRNDQPIGIFAMEFKTIKVSIKDLRNVLRKLVRKRALNANLPRWNNVQHLLFLCKVADNSFTFAQWRGDNPETATLTTFGWEPGEPMRTLIEYNLIPLEYSDDLPEEEWIDNWNEAFDVQKVTDEFFSDYQTLFDRTKAAVKGINSEEELKRFVLRLMNRLMFLRFVEKKRWLRINDRHDYLRALWEDYISKRDEDDNFYNERLEPLFFHALNNPDSRNLLESNKGWFLKGAVGEVPFLNGGLFDKTDYEKNENIKVPDKVFKDILDELIYHYNFTVTESTPLNVEVAIDPEMLGKIFEELVTGRHESGAYYTPKMVVSFMCKEAIKGYFKNRWPTVDDDKLSRFVDFKDGSATTDPEKILEALQEIKICDPACGSGAYLLGMLHELIELRKALFISQNVDQKSIYEKKLQIISNSLYGVDLDPFAVDIAKLRLWLSLIVDEERNPLDDPEADVSLPNLDFKIEEGDSLTAPTPEYIPDLFRAELVKHADEIAELKDRYLKAKRPEDKSELKAHIEKEEGLLSAKLERGDLPDNAFDWRVKFAEVFRNDGFDVVVANPPYVRQENIKPREYKEHILNLYSASAQGKSDLYVYFYTRALELLKIGGQHVFICSNSWLDVGYGGKLQEYLLKNAHVRAIYDSAVERQFSSASINTIISIMRKGKVGDDAETKFVLLKGPFELAIFESSMRQERVFTKKEMWENGFDTEKKEYVGDKWGGKYLRAPDIYWKILEKAGDKLLKLGDIAEVKRGFTTGANDFFYLEPTGQPAPSGCLHVRNKAGWEGFIEEEFLKPVIKSPRECKTIQIKMEDLKYKIFMCHKDKSELKGTYAVEYIKWGEGQEYNERPTCATRNRWWECPDEKGNTFWGKELRERLGVFVSQILQFVDCRLYTARLNNCIKGYLNSTVSLFIDEVSARQYGGGGGPRSLMVDEVKSLNVMYIEEISDDLLKWFFKRKVNSIFQELGLPKPARDYSNIDPADVSLDKVLPDRRALDKIVFEAIGLTEEEQLEVYRAVVELVKNRLVKAGSV
ncbi:N-6 DNA methylase [bacterium]|nr:N-6 DNA methylase [bacterium]